MKRNHKKAGLYKRWLCYVAHYLGWVALALGVVIVAVLIDCVVPRAFAFVIDHMLSQPGGVRMELPLVGPVGIAPAFLVVGLVLAALTAARGNLHYLRTVILTRVGELIHLEIRGELFERLHHLPMTFFDSSYTGRIMARVTTDADALWELLYSGVNGVVAPFLTLIVVLTIVATTTPLLSLILLVVVPGFVLLLARARKLMQPAIRRQREMVSSLYSRLQEQIAGVRTVRVFGQAVRETSRFRRILKLLYLNNMGVMRIWGSFTASSDVAIGLGTVLILCFGGWLVATARLSLGQLVQFYAYAGLLFSPILSIANTFARTFSQAEVALERIFELMDQKPAAEFSGGIRCPPLSGGVRVEGLSFCYRGGEPVLRDICLQVEPRWTAAIVGPSGAGKTTLVNLICRFYDFHEGKILIDGLDLTSLEVESFRTQVSYVFQETFLFSGTIYQNIQYAKPDASREEVLEAARLADAESFIELLPAGYDTALGERGVNLSGGQKQRLSIARALLRKPALLVMDEPTSSLDAESEAVILHAMDTVFRGMTRIVIAHRLSTVMHADRIFVLDKGRLIQQGTHRELSGREGLYRDLCRRQFLGADATLAPG